MHRTNAAVHGRNVLTLEHRLEWLNKFMHMQSDTHKLTHVANWDDWFPDCMYGLAFIDHAPAERRLPKIRRLLDLVEVFVIHDTEDPVYRYDQVLCVMELIETDITMKPWTTVVCPKH